MNTTKQQMQQTGREGWVIVPKVLKAKASATNTTAPLVEKPQRTSGEKSTSYTLDDVRKKFNQTFRLRC